MTGPKCYLQISRVWPSKVITRLCLLCLMIGLKISHQFFDKWGAKLNSIARDFSRALSKLQVNAGSSDWFIGLCVLFVIGRNKLHWHSFFDSQMKTGLIERMPRRLCGSEIGGYLPYRKCDCYPSYFLSFSCFITSDTLLAFCDELDLQHHTGAVLSRFR